MEEEIRETAWDLCKQYDAKATRRIKILLINFVTTELEKLFSVETENLFRNDWLEEVEIFCKKYAYAK